MTFDAQCLIFRTGGNGDEHHDADCDADQDDDENNGHCCDDEGTNLIRCNPYVNEVRLWLCWFVCILMSFDHVDNMESEEQCY